MNALFSTIILILKVQDNKNGIYMYLKQTYHILALISGKQKDAQPCESAFITTPFMQKNQVSVTILHCACYVFIQVDYHNFATIVVLFFVR